ncbi:low-density lipoprotein receptor-like isoform X2 [Aphis gossypii]|uniref:low-density lipoprotein receptor-like isoform X2 n=1 Tax=Aphis gossypii TaxID=80765 RepID=UPI0021590B9D|nr:low-density lipoprotein receptor-like isoform X2 [Aphis gossypii]
MRIITVPNQNRSGLEQQFDGLDLQDKSQPSSVPIMYVPPHLRNRPYNSRAVEPASCLIDEFRCNDGRCIYYTQYCDGIPHCSDGSDEEETCLEKKNRIDNSRDRPAPIIRAVGRNREVIEGGHTNLRCVLPRSSEQYTVKWSRNRSPLPHDSQIRGDVLSLRNLRLKDTGRYLCKVHSPYGSTYDYIDLRVLPSCLIDEFRCNDGRCIYYTQYCDGIPHCSDGSDEEETCLEKKNRIGL